MTEQTTLDVPPTAKAGAGDRTRLTTAELNELLHAHFIAPRDRLSPAGAGAVYLTEVTAPGDTRRADAVHIGLWSSRGAGRIDVCELKTSRSDFRRELENPAKAEAWWPYSTTFSIVSPGIDITPPEELPPGWGLLIPNPRAGARRFKTVVKPAEREPKLTIGLLLTLLKNTETTRVNALRQQSTQLRNQHHEELKKVRREKVTATDPRSQDRLELLDRLETAMGQRLGEHSWHDVIEVAEAAEGLANLLDGAKARSRARETAERQANQLERVAQRAQEEARELRKAHQ
ncbi:hypothetical protein [Streptomyces sp. NPDC005407]|uniref:hypothetical protein n=1 Tax=Streptomyces sp. NPDC005407 TaxID=3155340 RepID=UPI0033A7991F